MRIVKTISAMQRLARKWRREGTPVALVPTMGYLHQGHLSLIEKARACAGPKGRVVVSIYVNPTQFAPGEDLDNYPRDLDRDKKLCAKLGADVLFLPATAEIYPTGFSTYVVEEKLSQGMEGASRSTHFRGVTTIVAKLFNIVMPRAAIFGAKDFQQAAVVQQMARDLNFPLKIIVAPTVREEDGLAMSSRNKYLSPDQRRQAIVLWRVLQRARARVRGGMADRQLLTKELREIIRRQPEARLDYLEFFDSKTLVPASQIKKGARLALAVFIGKTRLIDNITL